MNHNAAIRGVTLFAIERWPAIALRLALSLLVSGLLASCVSLPPGSDFPRTPSSALANPESTWLGRRLDAALRAHGGKSGFRLLPVGIDGFLTRWELTDAAARTLDVQYYIFKEDDTGRLLTNAILRAADRGVRVRLLVDDSQNSARNARIALLDAHRNIEVRVFNPFTYRGDLEALRGLEFIADARRLDYRMHNKLFVVDNEVALVGGRNIGDEYFQASPQFEFGDYDVIAAGPIVRELSASFDEFWNSTMAIPVTALQHRPALAPALENYRTRLDAHSAKMKTSDYVRRLASGEPLASMISGRLPMIWANAKVLADSPYKGRSKEGDDERGRSIRETLDIAATDVRSELLIVSPYFVPGDTGVKLFGELRKRGVRVRVLTNSLQTTDVLLAHASYMHYRKPLLAAGVELYEVRPVLGNPRGSGRTVSSASAGRFALHAKVLVFDRRKLFIGSMNVDQRSLHLNTEIGLIIDSPELAKEVAKRFESIARPANSYVVTLAARDGGAAQLHWHASDKDGVIDLDEEPARDASQRAKVNFLSLLPLDHEM